MILGLHVVLLTRPCSLADPVHRSIYCLCRLCFDSHGLWVGESSALRCKSPHRLRLDHLRLILTLNPSESTSLSPLTSFSRPPQYYGFSQSFYDFTYRSRGNPDLSRLVVDTFEANDLSARLTPATESRGRDGRPQKSRPEGFVEAGLDHGVFIPFKRMFPDKDGKPFDIPIVEVSMAQDLSPDPQWELGAALKSLREQGILILAGGLTVHDFGDFTSFDQSRAKPVSRGILDKAIIN